MKYLPSLLFLCGMLAASLHAYGHGTPTGFSPQVYGSKHQPK